MIDADELNRITLLNGEYDKEHANMHFIYGIRTVMEIIDFLPTVQTEEPARKTTPYLELITVGYPHSEYVTRQHRSSKFFQYCGEFIGVSGINGCNNG